MAAFSSIPCCWRRRRARRRLCTVVSALLLLTTLAPPVAALTFILPSGGRQCFTDVISPATRVFGEIFVTASHGEMPVDVHVTDVASGTLMYKRENVGHVCFGFTTPSGHGAAGHRAPHVVDGQAAAAARAARAAAAAAAAQASGPGSGSGGGDEEGRRRSLLSAPAEEAKGATADGDAWAEREDFGLDEEDWAALDGDAPPPPDAQGADADDSDLWTTTRYEVCVSHSGAVRPATGVSRRVRLTLASGSSAHDFGRLAMRQHLGRLEVALRETSEELQAMWGRMDEVKLREDSLYHFNVATGAVVMRAAALSVGVLVLVSLLQAWAVRRHLNKKKVL